VIFGVGTDVVEIVRVQKALERWGTRFAHKILNEPELKRFSTHRLPANYLAKRFAAKEAFTKALGTGIRSPAGWHGMWVVNLPSGKPELRYTDALQDFLASKGVARSHLSLSDEKGIAFATVILECEK
jgi:holo-[acyl-carrier protein] synthase